MDFTFEKDKISIKDENNKEVAKVVYEERKEKEITVTHTFVDESLQGQGIAKKLMDELCRFATEKDMNIVSECSYATKYLEKQGK